MQKKRGRGYKKNEVEEGEEREVEAKRIGDEGEEG